MFQLSRFRVNGADQRYNHISMAGGKYFIPSNMIGNVIGSILATDGRFCLIPYYTQTLKFFADIDNKQNRMYMYTFQKRNI